MSMYANLNMNKIWTQELYREFSQICYQYNLKLKAPIIEITQMTSRYGDWNPLLRKIRISEDLIFSYPWKYVILVLKHEISHQIVHEVFLENDSSHGRLFKEACLKIGLYEPFSSACFDLNKELPTWNKIKTSYNHKKPDIVRKIEKLLSLSQSDNRFESELALQKALKLAKDQNYYQEDKTRENNFFQISFNFKTKRISNIKSMVASILQDYFDVSIIFSSEYSASHKTHYKTIEVLGSIEKLIFAEYVFKFLLERSESLWQAFKAFQNISKNIKATKNSFQIGLLQGFRSKLKAQVDTVYKDEHKKTNTLVCIYNQELKNFTKKLFPKIRHSQSSSYSIINDIYEKGVKEGYSLKLQKPLRKEKEPQRLLK